MLLSGQAPMCVQRCTRLLGEGEKCEDLELEYRHGAVASQWVVARIAFWRTLLSALMFPREVAGSGNSLQGSCSVERGMLPGSRFSCADVFDSPTGLSDATGPAFAFRDGHQTVRRARRSARWVVG